MDAILIHQRDTKTGKDYLLILSEKTWKSDAVSHLMVDDSTIMGVHRIINVNDTLPLNVTFQIVR